MQNESEKSGIEKISAEKFSATCIHCGSKTDLSLWPHRNGHGDMIGFVFACSGCEDVVRGIRMEIHGIRGHGIEPVAEMLAQEDDKTGREALRDIDACAPCRIVQRMFGSSGCQDASNCYWCRFVGERDAHRNISAALSDARAIIGSLLTWYDESDEAAALAGCPLGAMGDLVAKAKRWEIEYYPVNPSAAQPASAPAAPSDTPPPGFVAVEAEISENDKFGKCAVKLRNSVCMAFNCQRMFRPDRKSMILKRADAELHSSECSEAERR